MSVIRRIAKSFGSGCATQPIVSYASAGHLRSTSSYLRCAATGRENIFDRRTQLPINRSYTVHHMASVVDTYADCMLRNHFQLRVRIASESELQTFRVISNEVSRNPKGLVTQPAVLANLFNAYAKAINPLPRALASLFQKPFGRVLGNRQCALHCVRYIHYNPQKHGFVDDYRKWPYSSYPCATSENPSRLQRESMNGLVQWVEKPLSLPSGRNRLETDLLLVAG